MYTQEQIQNMIQEQKRIKDLIGTRSKEPNKESKGNFSFFDMIESYIDQRVAYLVSEMKPKDGEKGQDGYSPKKGTDYFDGRPGTMGVQGLPGKDADEIAIIKKVLKRMPIPKDGKSISPEELRPMIESHIRKMMSKMPEIITDKELSKRLDDRDTVSNKSLEKRLMALQASVMRNYGGHGGSTKNVPYTTSDNQTYTLNFPVDSNEIQVYRGGARQFIANGDFTRSPAGSNLITSITLSIPLDVAQGETLNILTR